MKSYRRKFLAYQDLMSSRPPVTEAAQPQQASAPKPTLSRAQRRKNAVFNRRLERRLKKDGTPAKVTVLPDGGLHVEASQRELELRHAEEETEDTDEGEEA